MTHYLDRITERLTPAEREAIEASVETFIVRHPRSSWAVWLLELTGQCGIPWSDHSNGDNVWAIVRDGEARTVMLRRHTQPSTPDAFGVRHVVADWGLRGLGLEAA